jgi:hypothetical protein
VYNLLGAQRQPDLQREFIKAIVKKVKKAN